MRRLTPYCGGPVDGVSTVRCALQNGHSAAGRSGASAPTAWLLCLYCVYQTPNSAGKRQNECHIYACAARSLCVAILPASRQQESDMDSFDLVDFIAVALMVGGLAAVLGEI